MHSKVSMSKENNNDSNNDKIKPKKKKSVTWDWKTLEENERENKLHPVTKKITEPKTPYTAYEGGDDEYFEKLNEVNSTKATDELLSKVINNLENAPESSLDKNEKFLEIEVIEGDGTSSKKLVKKEHINSKEFLQKKKDAYKGEYSDAIKQIKENKDEDLEDENKKKLLEKTMQNTLNNKFVGIAAKKIEDKKNINNLNLT